MKRPYLNQWQRTMIRFNTVHGAFLMLDFRMKQLQQDIKRALRL